ncbi:MAG: hypothetical protein HGA51_01630 [Demequinaceae bacterium]|nr:hypothetical protein [Demequinaceae bacterium]
MTDSSPQEIRDYCRAWSQRAAAKYRAERALGEVPRAHQGSPLATICEDLETADHERLSAVLAGMTVCMVRPGGIFAGYGRDYRLLWAWCAEVLAGAGKGAWFHREPTLGTLFAVASHAVLATEVPAQVLGVERHARKLVDSRAFVVPYLAFPLLEQTLRASCSRHFGADGRITHAFDTPGQLTRRHLYSPGGTCSSIGDLLWLYREHYASAEMGANLDQIDAHLVATVPGAQPGFRVIHQWRSETMSGNAGLPVIGAAVFSVAVLVALAGREHDFGEAVARTLNSVRAGGAGVFYPIEG